MYEKDLRNGAGGNKSKVLQQAIGWRQSTVRLNLFSDILSFPLSTKPFKKKRKDVKMIKQEGIKIETKVMDEEARIMLIGVSGYVDQANCHLMQEMINKSLKDKYYRLVFNLQNLVYMSSAGWGVLIGEIKRFRESSGDIKLANMGPEIYEIYQMLEFYHIISEYPSIEDALKSFNLKPKMVSASAPEQEAKKEKPKVVEKKSATKKAAPPRPAVKEKPATAELPPPEEKPLKPAQEVSDIKPEPTREPLEPLKPVATETFYEEPAAASPLSVDRPAEEPSPKPEESEAREATFQPEHHEQEAFTEEPSFKPDVSGEDKDVVIDQEIDFNIDGILANEGISTSLAQTDKVNYIRFDSEKYSRRIDIKVMPVPDKVRDIVSHHPELSLLAIRKMLRQPEYGGVKIGYFKLRSLLKSLELDTKEKRYRYHRSA